MTIEEILAAVLGPRFGGRVYPDSAPANARVPFAIYQQVGGQPVNFMAGSSLTRNGRFQIAVWSNDRVEASQCMREVETLLVEDARTQATVLGGAISTHDAEVKRYGAMQDFSIWFDV